VDLTILFDKLAEHYGDGSGNITDMDTSDTDVLVAVFDKMADFYSFGAGSKLDDATDLWVIYDSLSEMFGSASDYWLEDEEIEDLYQKMENGEQLDLKFENNIINDFSDLL